MTSSINPQEMDFFRTLSSSWWDEKGPYKALHQMGPARMEFIAGEIRRHFGAQPLTELSVLDVGCGGGLVAEPLARLGLNVTAIDALDENIQAARLHAESMGLSIDYRCQPVEELHESPFDIITCIEVIEHVDHLEDFLNHLKRLLKPEGLLIISTLNKTWQSKFFGIFVAENILKWAPKGAHHNDKFVSPQQLAHLCAPLSVSAVKGMAYHPLKQQFQLSQNIDINYIASLIQSRQ